VCVETLNSECRAQQPRDGMEGDLGWPSGSHHRLATIEQLVNLGAQFRRQNCRGLVEDQADPLHDQSGLQLLTECNQFWMASGQLPAAQA
jgi:hypothetical protein